MDRTNRPIPAPAPTAPTSSLPPLARISQHSSAQVQAALDNLRTIYFPPPPPTPARTIKVAKRNPKLAHLIHDASVPDSGYASAEDEEDAEETRVVEETVAVPLSPDPDPDTEENENANENEDENEELDILRSDAFERAFALKWLTGFAARADLWLDPAACPPADEGPRAALVDAAAALLAAFVGGEPEAAVTRAFSFPFGCSAKEGEEGETISVELNDAPLLSEDHTSVGLQSWASSILLAERMAADPDSFGLGPRPIQAGRRERRILELGAGTGLLSIATAKILERHGETGAKATIVATDFHPDVLANLQANVDANFKWDPVDVRPLDWEHPVYEEPFDVPFDIILAADVVYEPLHAAWIRGCVERLLVKPQGEDGAGGVFWMIIADRPSGRHAGLADTVFEVFPKSGGGEWDLVIVDVEQLEKQDGRGRADEGGYRLFKIGWARS